MWLENRDVRSVIDKITIAKASKVVHVPRVGGSAPLIDSNAHTMKALLRASRPVARAQWRTRCLRGITSVPAAQLSFGQPLHETHPHLLKAGEGATLHSGVCYMLTVLFSNAWYLCPGILRAPLKASRTSPIRLDSRLRCIRAEVRLWCRLLQIPSGSRLPIPHRLQRAGCPRYNREARSQGTCFPPLRPAEGSQNRGMGGATFWH